MRSGSCLLAGIVALLALHPACASSDSSPTAAGVQATQWSKASIHGHTIHSAVRGSGPTLVFLHGGGDSGEHSFVRQLDVFSEHHQIVAPDQVGQGRTPEVP